MAVTVAPADAGRVEAAADPTPAPSAWRARHLDDPAAVRALIAAAQGVVVASYMTSEDPAEAPATAEVVLACAPAAQAQLVGAIVGVATSATFEGACDVDGALVRCSASEVAESGDAVELVLRSTGARSTLESYRVVTAGASQAAVEALEHPLRQAVLAARAHGCRGGRGLATVPATRPDIPLAIMARTPVPIAKQSSVGREVDVRWAAPGQIVVVRARQGDDVVAVSAEGAGDEAPLVTIAGAADPGFEATVQIVDQELVVAASASGRGHTAGWLAGWRVGLDPASKRAVVREQFRADVGAAPVPAWLARAR